MVLGNKEGKSWFLAPPRKISIIYDNIVSGSTFISRFSEKEMRPISLVFPLNLLHLLHKAQLKTMILSQLSLPRIWVIWMLSQAGRFQRLVSARLEQQVTGNDRLIMVDPYFTAGTVDSIFRKQQEPRFGKEKSRIF